MPCDSSKMLIWPLDYLDENTLITFRIVLGYLSLAIKVLHSLVLSYILPCPSTLNSGNSNCWIPSLRQDVLYYQEFAHSVFSVLTDFLASLYSCLLLIIHNWAPKKLFLWTFLWHPNRIAYLFNVTITTCVHNSLH